MKLVKVEFHANSLEVEPQSQAVVIKDICVNLGINPKRQIIKLKSNPSFQSKLIKVQTAGGMQEVFTIPLSKLNGWLFSINPNKVKPEVKQKLIDYQNECFDVLHDYFNKGYAMKPEVKEALELEIKDLKNTIMYQNEIIAQQPTAIKNSSFMNDPSLHNNFLDFLYQANKAVLEINEVKHLSPKLDSTHHSLSNFMLFITRRYENIKGVSTYLKTYPTTPSTPAYPLKSHF